VVAHFYFLNKEVCNWSTMWLSYFCFSFNKWFSLWSLCWYFLFYFFAKWDICFTTRELLRYIRKL